MNYLRIKSRNKKLKNDMLGIISFGLQPVPLICEVLFRM